MTNKKLTTPITANALVWAALMLATALIVSGEISPEKSLFVLTLQIAGWFATNQLLVNNGRSIKAEWACIQRWLSKTKQG